MNEDTQKKAGKYELLDMVEEGPAGRLYRARNTETDRTVLLKLVPEAISQNAAFGRHFYEKWAEQQSLVEHPNILQVREVGQTDDTYYVIFEDVEGEPLSERLRQSPLPPDEALEIMHQAAEGLRAIHRRNLVHGHLKPSQILLARDKMDRLLVKVMLFDPAVTGPDPMISVFGELLGTPKYMAPEIIRGRTPGPEADIFALGVIAYEMLTGCEPFPSRNPVGYLFNNCELELEPPHKVSDKLPPEAARVVQRMLEKDPGERYRNAQRLVDDLDRCRESMHTGHVDVVPGGVDSAFARDYHSLEPQDTGGLKVPTGLAVVLLVLMVTAAMVTGFVLARAGWEWPVLAGQPAETRENGQGPRVQGGGGGPPATRRQPETHEDAAALLDAAMEDARRYAGKEQYELAVTALADAAEKLQGAEERKEVQEQLGRVYLEWAEALSKEGNYQKALANYTKAAEAAPPDSRFAQVAQTRVPAAMADLAEHLHRSGEYAAALEVYEKIAEEFPGTAQARLLENKKPELLVGRATVLRQEGDDEGALKLLLEVVNRYEGSKAAEDARQALPDIYLLSARQELEDGNLAQARQRLKHLIEAYPEHKSAAQTRTMYARLLLQLFQEARQTGRPQEAEQYYGELLKSHPDSPAAVEAMREALGIESAEDDGTYSESTARSNLRKAEGLRAKGDFPGALALLEDVLKHGRADSTVAMDAVARLPAWHYESALHAYGTGSPEECMRILEEVASRFQGTEWQRKSAVTVQRIRNPAPGTVYVPEGSFLMGTNLSEIAALAQEHNLSLLGGSKEEIQVIALAHGFAPELPKHSATTDAFFMDKTEVTNRQYKEFLEAKYHTPPPHWDRSNYPQGQGDHPVTNVTLNDAMAYADWRGARLPTEAEWEKAARGVDGRIYPWGNSFSRDYCHHMLPEDAGSAPVGSYPAYESPYGCLDMIGNVMEWTTEPFEPYEGNELELAELPGPQVVRRGGSWIQEELAPIPARCAARYAAHPADADVRTGFRCVQDVGAATPNDSDR